MNRVKVNNSNNRLTIIIARLKKAFPQARTALLFSNPLQLLISTILSAQCTDVRVNLVTSLLFAKYKSVKDFAEAKREELETDIKSTGFYRIKAKHIIEACQAMLDRFNGQIPRNLDALVSLPGVGRKTANCVLGGAYGIQSGIVVDTHVIRLSNRLALTKNDDPLKIEEDLMKIVEEKDWYRFSNLLILHGRGTCKAKKPLCEKCEIFDLCPSYSKLTKLTKHISRNK